MNILELLDRYSNSLIAITSVCAIIISVVSMVFTVIFSLFQRKHNKNSVRPISSIKANDYENEIAVKLQNVGTGPLTIEKLTFSTHDHVASTLISMMPMIDQYWSTFTESVDGWTIPVGGELVLLKLVPQTSKTRGVIRKELSQIAVDLVYSDIYRTRFTDYRMLDFFGRHGEQASDAKAL